MKNISKAFGATQALSEVYLKVEPGQIHALVGENGAGKSTLMNILSGTLKPDAGTTRLGKNEFLPRGPLDAQTQGIHMIHQELALAPHLSVTENIFLGKELRRGPLLLRSKMQQRARQCLTELGHSEIHPDTPVSELSVGASQLVEIARALIGNCRILILDEPTSSLSTEDTEQLFRLLGKLKAKGTAIIYISHFLEEVERIADYITVLRDGKVIDSFPTGEKTTGELIEKMVGRRVENLYPGGNRLLGEAVLEVKQLAGQGLPSDAGLTLHRGEVLGIFGLIGAGRTEMLRVLFGLRHMKEGQISVALGGSRWQGWFPPRRRWHQGLGFLSEDRKDEGLATDLSIAENLTLSHLEKFGRGGMLSPKKMQQASKNWMEKLQIRARDPNQAARYLSGGNQQRVALARLMSHDAEVWLLDEPTRGIDVAAKALIYQIIDQAARGQGEKPAKAVLMVSSYLPELLGLCDRVAVMHQGKLTEARPAEELDETQVLQQALGVDS